MRRRGSASEDKVPVSYGEPGRRLRASPFLFGSLATAGTMIVAAGFLALGLDRPASGAFLAEFGVGLPRQDAR